MRDRVGLAESPVLRLHCPVMLVSPGVAPWRWYRFKRCRNTKSTFPTTWLTCNADDHPPCVSYSTSVEYSHVSHNSRNNFFGIVGDQTGEIVGDDRGMAIPGQPIPNQSKEFLGTDNTPRSACKVNAPRL